MIFCTHGRVIPTSGYWRRVTISIKFRVTPGANSSRHKVNEGAWQILCWGCLYVAMLSAFTFALWVLLAFQWYVVFKGQTNHENLFESIFLAQNHYFLAMAAVTPYANPYEFLNIAPPAIQQQSALTMEQYMANISCPLLDVEEMLLQQRGSREVSICLLNKLSYKTKLKNSIFYDHLDLTKVYATDICA